VDARREIHNKKPFITASYATLIMNILQSPHRLEAGENPQGQPPLALGPRPATPIDSLLDRRPDLWRGRAVGPALPAGVPTGFAALDRELPWGGWPPAGLIELLVDDPGEGLGLGLVLPALAQLGAAARWLLLVDPPWHPFAPALAAGGLVLERLVVARAGEAAAWAAEQGLRSGACAAVLLWGGRWSAAPLRRLQLAAETGGAPAFLFRDSAAARHPSPAPLRLGLGTLPGEAGYRLEVIKQRGGRPGALLNLAVPEDPVGR
jgi:hypothetical protein